MSAVISTPRDLVETVAKLHLPALADRRLQILMDRNNNGLLTSEEHDDLRALVEVSELLSLVRADALQVLRQQPS